MLDINLYSLEGTDEFSGKRGCYGRWSISYRFLNMMSMTVVQTVPQFSLCSGFLFSFRVGIRISSFAFMLMSLSYP
jgi:hypothetical protein